MQIYKTEDFMKHSKNMHIFMCHCDRPEALHGHDFIEIVYILSGKMTHIVDGQQYDVSHGDLLFMNYGCTHAFHGNGPYKYINILFSPEIISEGFVTPSNVFSTLSLTAFNEMRSGENFGKLSYFGNERKEIEDIILAMLDEYQRKQNWWETVMGNYLNTLLAKMLRKTEAGIKSVEIKDMWRELSEYIDSNLGNDLTLSALAQKCFYNPSYFSRIFKEKFGCSLTEYITRKRLDYAIELLGETELSLDEISSRTGFSDRNSFYYAFSRYLGGKPTDYRKSKIFQRQSKNL